MSKIKWHRTIHGRWVRAHHAGDPAQNPKPLKDLDPPHGPTSERLTIQPTPGLQALDEKYAAELERGRMLRNRLP